MGDECFQRFFKKLLCLLNTCIGPHIKFAGRNAGYLGNDMTNRGFILAHRSSICHAPHLIPMKDTCRHHGIERGQLHFGITEALHSYIFLANVMQSQNALFP